MPSTPKYGLLWRTTAIAGAAALALSACSPLAENPSGPEPALEAAFGVPLNFVTNATPAPELLKVCKVYVGQAGGPVNIDAVARDAVTNAITHQFSVTLADGECRGIWADDLQNGPPDNVTVTETPVPGGYSVTVQKFFTDQGPSPIVNSNTTTDFATFAHGVTVVFTNTFEPPRGLEGCTPGYYKNLRKHEFAWDDAGYSPNALVSSVFASAGSAPYTALGNATLHEGLSFQGGDTVEEKAEILLRAAIAAVLNASNPDVAYPFTAANIIATTNAALDSQDADFILALATVLDNANNGQDGCPLGNGSQL